MKRKLIIYGTGKFAEYVAYAFNNDSNYSVTAFCVEKKLLKADQFANKPLIDFAKLESTYPPDTHSIFIAVGNNLIREQFFSIAKDLNYEFATYISSQCRKWENLMVGENCFIDEGCIIQPFVTIEDNCILFAADIGHHTRICANTLFSGAITGGNVHIGEFSYIGLKSAIKQNVHIGKYTVVGMGCNIENDTKDYEVYTHKGTTKRKITSEQLGNRFLN